MPRAASLAIGVLGACASWASAPPEAIASESAACTAPEAEPEELTCFGAWARPIYQGLGWTHFVDVFNACGFALTCQVATTVDVAPIAVSIPDGLLVRVRVRYGSNTPEYAPLVSCTPAPS